METGIDGKRIVRYYKKFDANDPNGSINCAVFENELPRFTKISFSGANLIFTESQVRITNVPFIEFHATGLQLIYGLRTTAELSKSSSMWNMLIPSFDHFYYNSIVLATSLLKQNHWRGNVTHRSH